MYTVEYLRSLSIPELREKLFDDINRLRRMAAAHSVRARRSEQSARNKCLGNELISHWENQAEGGLRLHELVTQAFRDLQYFLFLYGAELVGHRTARSDMIYALQVFDRLYDQFFGIELASEDRGDELERAVREELYQQWCGPRTK